MFFFVIFLIMCFIAFVVYFSPGVDADQSHSLCQSLFGGYLAAITSAEDQSRVRDAYLRVFF